MRLMFYDRINIHDAICPIIPTTIRTYPINTNAEVEVGTIPVPSDNFFVIGVTSPNLSSIFVLVEAPPASTITTPNIDKIIIFVPPY